MTEFTDGTAKGKTLSLVGLEKRLEALENKKSIEAETGITETITVQKLGGCSLTVNTSKQYKETPKIFAELDEGMEWWSHVNIRVTGSTVWLWNNSDYDSKVKVRWLAIGERG